MRWIVNGGVAVVFLAATALGATPAIAQAPDSLTAVNVVPPGQSGQTTLAQFGAATAGLSSSYGPNTDNQLGLYAGWQYKPMQFSGQGTGGAPPGDPNVLITRDASYGVPTITGASESDLFYGIGYAMAGDRLFQMEVFRHVGHGTLAELIGAGGLTMDEAVRRYTEGDAALQREYAALPPDARTRLQRFVDGINAYIVQVQGNSLQMPAEFSLLADLPIKPWTVNDVLGFGEYAGRFFGEFGHGELGALATYEHLLKRYGRRRAETLFNDILPLNDPHAPTSISPTDGRFPRHVGRRVRTRFRGSIYANHNPKLLPALAQASDVATAVDERQSLVSRLQRVLALPRFGSNAVIVAPRLSSDHKAMLYGGPQTGWAVPGFFWEAELHSPARDQKGVMVPAIPLLVIGRNSDAAWTVTSALDANADTFVEQLNQSNSSYTHKGRRLAVQIQHETIGCRNTPAGATSLLMGSAPQLCPSQPKTLTVYRTIHGPAVADPDAGHHLYVRQSVVDGRLLKSLTAWDLAGRQHDTRSFASTLRQLSLGFNFFYADDRGQIGYWHTGTYPVHPRNADPRLPLPGGGAYDWQGFERWRAHPHVINPRPGFLVNWNNKPAVGWYSKNLETGGEGGIWGDQWESVPLAADVPRRVPLTLQTLGQVPHDVAYIDNPARVIKPYLIKALAHASDPQLLAIKPYLQAWNGNRDQLDGKGGYSTPAVVFFDRFVELLMRNAEAPLLGADWVQNAGLSCATCHLVSVDNLTTPTYKLEYPGMQLLAAALVHHTRYRWLRNRDKMLLQAARETTALLAQAQGGNPAAWNEPAESAQFSAQGGISVPAITPLPNRGSYGQVVEGR